MKTSDAWIPLAWALAALDAAVASVLHVRPGLPAVALWYFGPPALALGAAGLLVGALVWSFSSGRAARLPDRRRVVAFLAAASVVISVPFYRVYPSSHDDKPSQVRFRVPLAGSTTVAWGGPAPASNYHVVAPDARWAYDLLVTRNGTSFRGAGQNLADYYAYDLPALAAADGTVRAVHDGEPDTAIGGRWRAVRGLGNHVVLDVAAGQFLFIAHLRKGSIEVRAGERVRAGQVIGRVGNSGASTEPHVHLHLQSTPTPYFGEGIPFFFYGYRHDGRLIARGMPEGGIRDGRFLGQVIAHAFD